MIYVDTSSALKILLAEDGTDQVRDFFEAAKQTRTILVSSRLLRTEMHRIAYRESVPVAEVSAVLSYVHLVDLTRDIVDSAAQFRLHLRTLDAIHLATGVELNEGDDDVRLLTEDTQMARAGAELGLLAAT